MEDLDTFTRDLFDLNTYIFVQFGQGNKKLNKKLRNAISEFFKSEFPDRFNIKEDNYSFMTIGLFGVTLAEIYEKIPISRDDNFNHCNIYIGPYDIKNVDGNYFRAWSICVRWIEEIGIFRYDDDDEFKG